MIDDGGWMSQILHSDLGATTLIGSTQQIQPIEIMDVDGFPSSSFLQQTKRLSRQVRPIHDDTNG